MRFAGDRIAAAMADERTRRMLQADRYEIGNLTLYKPWGGDFVSVSPRDGGATRLLTVEEANNLMHALIQQTVQ